MLEPTDIVNIIVTTKPQRVYAVVKDKMHTGKFKTANPGENAVTADEGSNERLLNAALMMWAGQPHFTTTAFELEKHSGGYGIQ